MFVFGDRDEIRDFKSGEDQISVAEPMIDMDALIVLLCFRPDAAVISENSRQSGNLHFLA